MNTYQLQFFRLKILVRSHQCALCWVKIVHRYQRKKPLTTLDATGYGDEHHVTFWVALTKEQRATIKNELILDRDVKEYEFRRNGKLC